MLTREETAALPAGQKLDELILEMVYGVPAKRLNTPDYSNRSYYIPSGKPWRTHQIDARPVPYFSTEIDAAWLVVVRMQHLLYFSEHTDLSLDSATAWWAWHFESAANDRFSATADSAPLAICRAALLALSPAPATLPIQKQAS